MKTLFKQVLFFSLAVSILVFGNVQLVYAKQNIKNALQCSTAQQHNSLLLVLSAQKGVLKQTGQGYTLTLQAVDPKVLWFTDRPERHAGLMVTKKFITNWEKGFKNSQPNALLSMLD